MDHVLKMLLNSESYLSGEEIGRVLGISRTAVWKHIRQIEEKGFVIESVQKKGYKILSNPQERIVPELVENYYGGVLPFEMIALKSADSTNSLAKQYAVEGKFDRDFIITADDQTSGRGRLSRKWEAFPGKDLAVTVCLTVNSNIHQFYRYTIMAALVVFEVLFNTIESNEKHAAGKLKIKWPNDIYFDNRKICGILSEMITEEGLIKQMIIGMGVNVNSEPSLAKAVSLKQITRSDFDRNRILSEIIKRLAVYSGDLAKGGFDWIFEKWKSHLGWLGEPIRFDTGREIITGILKDIEADGSILVENNKIVNTYYSGDLIV